MELLYNILPYVIIICLIVILIGIAVLFFTSKPPNMEYFDSENFFVDPANSNRKQKFPSIEDKASVDLSVIVPAYNEEERMPIMMDEVMEYMTVRQKNSPQFTYEVIVVDDGSSDKTTEIALSYSTKHGVDKVRVLTFERNRGKGGAVRAGMLKSRGQNLLFADADGATKFSDIEKLEAEIKIITPIKDGMAIVCGSRAHLEKDSIAQRSFFRTILMKGFHFLVWFLCVRGVNDTQCGFKLLTRHAARLVFHNLHVDRWAFDVDLLHIAQHYSIPVGEVAVVWQEIEGSKVTPFWSWLQMGRDLLIIRLRYLLGAWRMDHHLKQQ